MRGATKTRKRSPGLAGVPFAALLLLGVVGCQEDAGVNSEFGLLDLQSGEFAVFDFQDAMDGVQAATLETPMSITPGLLNGGFFKDGGPFGRRGPRGPQGPRMFRSRSGNHLGQILRRLVLSDDQKSQIRELMSGHRECVQGPLQRFREANAGILESANAGRQEILDKVRSGGLSREDARAQLTDLSEETRAAIKNNPESLEIRQELCECKGIHFDNVREVLVGDQQISWDEWVAGLEGACFGDG